METKAALNRHLTSPSPSTVQERAEALAGSVFLGGPVKDFEAVGRLQLITLLQEGLEPGSRVLDVGCGCLRGGYWMIHFLEPDCYFGIEPAREMLEVGVDRILEPGLVDAKRPRFAHNDDWDFSVFGVPFDFLIARSVWTHASKPQIEAMLDGFARTAAPGGRMLVSYRPAGWQGARRGSGLRSLFADYRGEKWVGRSHEQDESGLVRHSRRWIAGACRSRGLAVAELPGRIINHQHWLRISRESGS